MFKKTAIAAAIAATAIAAPVASASATGISFGFNTPHGHFSFGTGGGGYYPHPQAMSCWQAKHYLKSQFAHVWTVECHGKIYTFNVKNWGPTKTVKLNKYTGNFWYA